MARLAATLALASCCCGLARAAPGVHTVSMRARSRPLHEEIHSRVSRYVAHAAAHLGSEFAAAAASTVMPNHESTAYWA